MWLCRPSIDQPITIFRQCRIDQIFSQTRLFCIPFRTLHLSLRVSAAAAGAALSVSEGLAINHRRRRLNYWRSQTSTFSINNYYRDRVYDGGISQIHSHHRHHHHPIILSSIWRGLIHDSGDSKQWNQSQFRIVFTSFTQLVIRISLMFATHNWNGMALALSNNGHLHLDIIEQGNKTKPQGGNGRY